jgi:flagellar protein FliS
MEQDALNSYPQNAHLAAYRSISAHGAVSNADPHGLVLMLMDGAMDRMATARGCMERGDIVQKAKLLHSCVILIGELRGSLNLAQGGPLAQNLSDLYDYMIRRLLVANGRNDVACLNEVMHLLGEIRLAWVAIGPQVREMARTAAPAA